MLDAESATNSLTEPSNQKKTQKKHDYTRSLSEEGEDQLIAPNTTILLIIYLTTTTIFFSYILLLCVWFSGVLMNEGVSHNSRTSFELLLVL